MKTNLVPSALVLSVGCLLAGSGCQSRYETSYRPAAVAAATQPIPPQGNQPRVISTRLLNEEMQTLQSSGYTVIGSSSFVTTDWKPEWARRMSAGNQGKAVGADIVLLTVQDGVRQSAGFTIDTNGFGNAPPHGTSDNMGVIRPSAMGMSVTAVYLRKNEVGP